MPSTVSHGSRRKPLASGGNRLPDAGDSSPATTPTAASTSPAPYAYSVLSLPPVRFWRFTAGRRRFAGRLIRDNVALCRCLRPYVRSGSGSRPTAARCGHPDERHESAVSHTRPTSPTRPSGTCDEPPVSGAAPGAVPGAVPRASTGRRRPGPGAYLLGGHVAAVPCGVTVTAVSGAALRRATPHAGRTTAGFEGPPPNARTPQNMKWQLKISSVSAGAKTFSRMVRCSRCGNHPRRTSKPQESSPAGIFGRRSSGRRIYLVPIRAPARGSAT